MGMGFAKLVLWVWEWLGWNGREWKLYIISRLPMDSWSSDTLNGPLFWHSNLSYTVRFHPKCPHATLRALTLHVYCWRFGWFFSSYGSTVPCIVELTGHLLSDRDTTSSTGMEAAGNGNNRWEWEGNGNKTRLNLGVETEMGIDKWEWEGMGILIVFPHTSN